MVHHSHRFVAFQAGFRSPVGDNVTIPEDLYVLKIQGIILFHYGSNYLELILVYAFDLVNDAIQKSVNCLNDIAIY